MDNDLKIILDFLSRCSGAEVEGRSLPEPDSIEGSLLLRFARGACTPDERAEACALMQGNRPLLRWVSDQVKARRFASANGTTRDQKSNSAS